MGVYLKKLGVNDPLIFKKKGPLLLACNHPNSFLDAIIFSVLFQQPVHSLARGDAFKGKLANKILKALHMLPVYRTSEGVENLEHNYDTFAACLDIFRSGGIVLIFSEGRCENEWKLRPLKKGTARLALSAWNAGIDLCVLPVGLNYHSFKSYEKMVQINFGPAISPSLILGETEGKKLVAFNAILTDRLKNLVYGIKHRDKLTAIRLFKHKEFPVIKILLFIPAVTGMILHYSFVKMLKRFVIKKTNKNGHTDSIFFALLFFTYPLYLTMLVALTLLVMGSWGWLSSILIPITAWCYVNWKKATHFAE